MLVRLCEWGRLHYRNKKIVGHLRTLGLYFGYFPNDKNFWTIAKPYKKENVRVFKETNTNIKKEGKKAFGRGDRLTRMSKGIRQ